MFFIFDFFFMGIVVIVLILSMLLRALPALTRRFRKNRKQSPNIKGEWTQNQDVIETEFVDDPEDENYS